MWGVLLIAGVFIAPFALLFILFFAAKIVDAIQETVSSLQMRLGDQFRMRRLFYLKTLNGEQLIRAAMAGESYALEFITEPETLELIRKETPSETVRRKICDKLGHEWVLTHTQSYQCSMSGDRGSGQYLDPCYGVDCQFCDEYSRTEYIYSCKSCGMEKRE